MLSLNKYEHAVTYIAGAHAVSLNVLCAFLYCYLIDIHNKVHVRLHFNGR